MGDWPYVEDPDGGSSPSLHAQDQPTSFEFELQDVPNTTDTLPRDTGTASSSQDITSMFPPLPPPQIPALSETVLQTSSASACRHSNHGSPQQVPQTGQGMYGTIMPGTDVDSKFGFVNLQQVRLQYQRPAYFSRTPTEFEPRLGDEAQFVLNFNTKGKPQAHNVKPPAALPPTSEYDMQTNEIRIFR